MLEGYNYINIKLYPYEEKMEYSQIIIKVVMLYVLIAVGMLVNKIGIINDDGSANISRLIVYVTMPCAILSGITSSEGMAKSESLMVFVIFLISFFLLVFVSLFITKILVSDKSYKPFYQFIAIFGNVAFVGIPMSIAIVGEHSVLFASVLAMLNNVMFFSYGIYLLKKTSEKKTKNKSIWLGIFNPGSISAILGLVLFFLDVKIPSLVYQPVSTLGSLTSPLAMIVIGVSLNKIKIKEILKDYRIIIIVLVKMILGPILLALLLKTIGITGAGAMAAVVLTGMPVSMSSAIIVNEYNPLYSTKMSQTVLMSTLMLLFTAPVLVWAVGLLR